MSSISSGLAYDAIEHLRYKSMYGVALGGEPLGAVFTNSYDRLRWQLEGAVSAGGAANVALSRRDQRLLRNAAGYVLSHAERITQAIGLEAIVTQKELAAEGIVRTIMPVAQVRAFAAERVADLMESAEVIQGQF